MKNILIENNKLKIYEIIILVENNKLKIYEIIILVASLIFILYNYFVVLEARLLWQNTSLADSPYSEYYQNNIIYIITITTNFLNFFNIILILTNFFKFKKFKFKRYLIISCLLLSLLPWLEIWYGSTFYYGEIRDKKGIPFGFTNLGLIGSYLLIILSGE
jgi:hypothetical protein